MKKYIKWIILSIIMFLCFSFTFMKSPENIIVMLQQVSSENVIPAVIIHILTFSLLVLGIFIKKHRTILFSIFLLSLSASAAFFAVKYIIPPNIILFSVFFILTVAAIKKGQLQFQFSKTRIWDRLVGITALIFAFYYLHWVESPVFLNALIYSPLGLVNCPTMLAFSGLLCFIKKPGAPYLEFFVGGITLYFGFFGMMSLGAYIDIILVISGLFLLIRLASRLNPESFYNS